MFFPGVEENHVKFQASSLAPYEAEALHWRDLHIHLQKPSLAQLRTTDQLLIFVSRGRSELRIRGRYSAFQGILSIADGIEPQDSSWVVPPFALELQVWALGRLTPLAVLTDLLCGLLLGEKSIVEQTLQTPFCTDEKPVT